MSNDLRVAARFERNLICLDGESIRYLLVELSAAPKTLAAFANDTPINLALVIDCSRSMHGSRMASAIKAAEGIINRLSDNDYVSIVSFSGDTQIHADGLACDKTGKAAARAALNDISVRPGTNISAGWFRGAECLGNVMQKHSNMKNHIVLLTDGHANEGTLDPAALAHHATQLQMRAVTASAVGVGSGYSSSQIYSIAQYGGGRIHHAAHSPEIIQVVLGELDELRDRTLENIRMEIEFPEDVAFKELNIIPTHSMGQHASCDFGGLSAGKSRSAIFRVSTPAGKQNQNLNFVINTHYRPTGQEKVCAGQSSTAVLRFVDANKNQLQPVDDDVALKIAILWQSWLVFEATNMNRMRQYEKLENFLAKEIKYFKRFCKVSPQCSILLSDLLGLSRIANQDWDEASRKEIQTSTYTSLYGLSDTRSGRVRNWQEYTGQFFGLGLSDKKE